jgi:tetratricopeptide (TPR) repeat protein
MSGYVLHVFLLIVVTSLAFSNTLGNTYHLDSLYRIQQNTEIDKFWPPLRFFTDIRTGSTIPQIAEYRPMMPLSHAINSELSRVVGIDRLAGFHIGNIAIHIGSAILMYALFCLLISNWGSAATFGQNYFHYSHRAFFAVQIFAIHPISGAAVNYIAARDLLLMVFFFSASMLTYVAMRRKGDSVGGWVASLLLLSLAILSKQVAILGFALVFLFEWILVDTKLKNWRLWMRTLLFSIPTMVYFLLRYHFLVQSRGSAPLPVPLDVYYPLTMAKAHVFYYLNNLVWPFEMRALARVEFVESMFDPAALLGVLFICCTLILAFYFRKREPIISFSILAYWLLFSLTASIFPFRFLVTDYRQYLPLAFFCLGVSVYLFSMRRTAIQVILVVLTSIYFSIATFQINKHWKTEESFWGQSVKYGAVALAHNNYALAIARTNPGLAEHHLLEAIKQSPTHIYANINLGMHYLRNGKKADGLRLLSKMVKLNPDWALAHYWLAEGLKLNGEKDKAIVEVKTAADMDPHSLKYQHEAGRAIQSDGVISEAIPYLKRAVEMNPDYELVEFWLGFAYQKTGRSNEAIASYERFLERNPNHMQTQFNLAYELMKMNDCQTAVAHFKKVLSLKPGYLEVHLHLSNCYRALGNQALSEKHGAIYRN